MMKKLTGFLLLIVMLCTCLCFSALADELAAPSSFSFNAQTGEFTFTSNDDNAGYYFVRVYPLVNGVEATEYVASSKRINAGKMGEKSGKVNIGDIGWGEYDVKLITFAASGTDYTAPAPVIVKAFYGVGGMLEKPEMMVVADGNTVEVTVDRYTLSDYKDFQLLPVLRFTLWADEECQTEVETMDVDANELAVDTHPVGAYIWPYSLTSGHMNLVSTGDFGDAAYNLTPEATFTAAAGNYFVTVQAISPNEEKIASSKLSDVIAVTLTDDAPSIENFDTVKSSLWADPAVMGMPCAASGGAEGRVDAGNAQTTSCEVN